MLMLVVECKSSLNYGANVTSTFNSDVEMISLAITPSASDSKVLIMFGVGAQLNTDEYASFDLYRGSLLVVQNMDGAEKYSLLKTILDLVIILVI